MHYKLAVYIFVYNNNVIGVQQKGLNKMRYMKLIKHIKKILIVSMIAVMFMMVGCSNNSEQSNASGNNNANKNTAFQIPEVGATGGYEINSDAFYCIVAVDNDYKYYYFEYKK
jgi:hypothetical protein